MEKLQKIIFYSAFLSIFAAPAMAVTFIQGITSIQDNSLLGVDFQNCKVTVAFSGGAPSVTFQKGELQDKNVTFDFNGKTYSVSKIITECGSGDAIETKEYFVNPSCSSRKIDSNYLFVQLLGTRGAFTCDVGE